MLNLTTYMMSCSARDDVRQHTICKLREVGWEGTLIVEFDSSASTVPLERHTILARRVLWRAAQASDDVFLWLEDDLDFNRHFVHNLENWPPLKEFVRGEHLHASLYNPGVKLIRSFPQLCYGEALQASALGTQSSLISKTTARYLVTAWGVESCVHADIRLARLAARVCPLIYHLPSLVQHVGVNSMWGGPFHQAVDFDKNWIAPASTTAS